MNQTDTQVLRSRLEDLIDLTSRKVDLLELRVRELEEEKKDHEERLRELQETQTQFKTLMMLATGGGLLSFLTLLQHLLGK